MKKEEVGKELSVNKKIGLIKELLNSLNLESDWNEQFLRNNRNYDRSIIGQKYIVDIWIKKPPWF
jgi:hypothetical protein|tara:strand:+ start:893 stop:1087 length:195 start_codon:yes stop_codon:yes gene_type:complete